MYHYQESATFIFLFFINLNMPRAQWNGLIFFISNNKHLQTLVKAGSKIWAKIFLLRKSSLLTNPEAKVENSYLYLLLCSWVFRCLLQDSSDFLLNLFVK